MRGRKPMFCPTFSTEEMELVEQTLRRSNAPFAQVRRAQLAKLLADDPAIRNVEAARRLGVHEQFVHKWRQRWTEGEFALDDLPRSGRPREFPPSADHDHQEHCLRIARPA